MKTVGKDKSKELKKPKEEKLAVIEEEIPISNVKWTDEKLNALQDQSK